MRGYFFHWRDKNGNIKQYHDERQYIIECKTEGILSVVVDCKEIIKTTNINSICGNPFQIPQVGLGFWRRLVRVRVLH